MSDARLRRLLIPRCLFFWGVPDNVYRLCIGFLRRQFERQTMINNFRLNNDTLNKHKFWISSGIRIRSQMDFSLKFITHPSTQIRISRLLYTYQFPTYLQQFNTKNDILMYKNDITEISKLFWASNRQTLHCRPSIITKTVDIPYPRSINLRQQKLKFQNIKKSQPVSFCNYVWLMCWL